MKKSFNIFLALVIAFFTLPFGGMTALADEKVYDDIEDGEYEININALDEHEDKDSAAAGFIGEKADLSIQGEDITLTLEVAKGGEGDGDFGGFDFDIEWIKIEKKDPIDEYEDDSAKYFIFQLDSLQTTLPAQIRYVVPNFPIEGQDMEHEPEFRLELNGLDDLPVKEEDDSNDLRNDEALVENADETHEIEYITDSSATNNYFDNPVSLLIKDDKRYIEMNGTGGKMIKSLTVNGTEVTWVDEDDDGNFIIQFELPGSPSDAITFGMVIDTGVPGMGVMEHDVSLSFEEPKEDPEGEEPKEEDPKEEDPKEEDPKEDPKGEDPKEDPKPEEEPKEEDLLKPDKAHKIDYDIYHEDGSKPSISNDFFEKPALLFEKDGKKYVQITITNGDMIKDLSNKYGDALLVKENEDGSIVLQLRVDDDLADMLLDMHIVVPSGAIPGFPGYDEEHKAILVFDKDSMKEIDVGDHMLVGTNNPENTNGPTVEDGTPSKPSFGKNGDNGDNGEEIVKSDKTDNPQTGDTTSIILYTMLLIGSLIPLAVKFRRRFI